MSRHLTNGLRRDTKAITGFQDKIQTRETFATHVTLTLLLMLSYFGDKLRDIL